MKSTLKYSALAVAVMASANAFPVALEEIVVTAQFKQETLQDAGLAIDAVDAERLVRQGVTSAADLAKLVPALTITDAGGISGLLFVRGVGNTANNDYLDPAIIMTYDGVAMARGSATAINGFYDLERVEVLKGPQGTLYGKNATGGVINLIPAKPKLGETSGFINGSFGNYDDRQFSGAINLPMGENSALRVAANKVEHDGYNKDGTNDADKTGFRAQFLTEVNDQLTVRVGADYSDIGGVGGGTTPVGQYVPTGVFGNYALLPSGLAENEGQNTAAGNAFRNTVLSAPGFGFLDSIRDENYVDAEMVGVNAEINYTTDHGTLTIIPAWRKTEQDSKFSHPGFDAGWWQGDVEQKSLEVRFSGTRDGILSEYLIGAYYFDEELEGNNTFNQNFVLPMQDYTQEGDSKAIFGQITWDLADNLRLITGVRYTDDHKELAGQIDNYIVFCGGLPPNNIVPPASFGAGCATPGVLPQFPTLDTPAEAQAWLIDNGWASTFIPIPPGELIPLNNGAGTILHSISKPPGAYDKSKTTYRISMEWDVLEDSMIYVSFETGYRAGGLQPSETNMYEEELLDAYVIGTKNRFLDGSLQFNAELFFWDYQDQQISYFAGASDGTFENRTDNVGATTNKGVDLDLLWQAGENTLISTKLQWLDASYDDLHFISVAGRDNINCPNSVYEGQSYDFDCSGNDAIFSPEWTWQFAIQHTIPLGSMNLIASLDTTWVDDQVTGFFNLAHEVIEDHWTTNLDLTLMSADETWSVSAYARNLEDDRTVQSTQTPIIGIATASYGADMTYGMRFGYRF